MQTYAIYKRLDDGALKLVHTKYAATAQEARRHALDMYAWNRWLTDKNIIIKKYNGGY